MELLLLFLLLLSDLASADDNRYVQDVTVACTGQQARFRWNYEVKSYLGVVWTHNEEEITSSESLLFSPVTTSDQFKGRLTFNSTDPFSFTLENVTDADNGVYECVFHIDGGKTDYVMGMLDVKDLHKNDSLVEEMESNGSCVTLSCKADPPCKWTFPNDTTKFAKTIRYCWKKAKETIRCESVCTYANYHVIFLGEPKETSNSTVLLVCFIFGGLIIAVVAVFITLYMWRRCKEPLTIKLPQYDDEDQNEEKKEDEATKL